MRVLQQNRAQFRLLHFLSNVSICWMRLPEVNVELFFKSQRQADESVQGETSATSVPMLISPVCIIEWQRFELILRTFNLVLPSWESNNALISSCFSLFTGKLQCVILFAFFLLHALRKKINNNFHAISKWVLKHFFIKNWVLVLLIISVLQISYFRVSDFISWSHNTS